MLELALSLTYLGIVLLYAASPASAASAVRPVRRLGSMGLLRGAGLLVLGTSVGLAVLSGPVGEGLLVWVAMAMASCSIVVIAGPLAGPLFLPGTSLLALCGALLSVWG